MKWPNVSFIQRGIYILIHLYPNSISTLSEPQNHNIDDRDVVFISSTPAYSHKNSTNSLFKPKHSLKKEKTEGIMRKIIAACRYLPCFSDLHLRGPFLCKGVFLIGESFRFTLHETEIARIK